MKNEKLIVHDDYIMAKYCLIKRKITMSACTIEADTRWEFISLNYETHIMTLRSSKGPILQYDIQVQIEVE
jgi:hypothetical protein